MDNLQDLVIGQSSKVQGKDLTVPMKNCFGKFSIEKDDFKDLIANLDIKSIKGITNTASKLVNMQVDSFTIYQQCIITESDDPNNQYSDLYYFIKQMKQQFDLLISQNQNKAAIYKNLVFNKAKIQVDAQDFNMGFLKKDFSLIGSALGDFTKTLLTIPSEDLVNDAFGTSSELDNLQNIMFNDTFNVFDEFIVGLADGFEGNPVGEKIKKCRLEAEDFIADLKEAQIIQEEQKAHITEWGKIIKAFESVLSKFTTIRADCLEDTSPITAFINDLMGLGTSTKLWFNHVAEQISNYDLNKVEVESQVSNFELALKNAEWNSAGSNLGMIIRETVFVGDADDQEFEEAEDTVYQ